MKLVPLKPIQVPQTFASELEAEIRRAVTEGIYRELLQILKLKPKTIKNALTTSDVERLREALREGTLTYNDGMFTGSLDAGLTRALKDAGATWDQRLSSFRLSEDEMDPELRSLISQTVGDYQKKLAQVDRYLRGIDPEEVSGKVAVNRLFENALKKTESSFKSSIGAITLTPELDDFQRERIIAEWHDQTKRSIQGLVEDQVSRLRARVADSVDHGNRYTQLVRGIKEEHSVSQGRAKLIARQETKTLTNEYAKARYADAGVTEYRWMAVVGTKAHPVRSSHQELADRSKKGETFRFDQPPLLMSNGQYGNPGDDFNCRCWAQPVVKFGSRS